MPEAGGARRAKCEGEVSFLLIACAALPSLILLAWIAVRFLT